MKLSTMNRAKLSVGNLYSTGTITREEAIKRLVAAGMSEAEATAYMAETFPL